MAATANWRNHGVSHGCEPVSIEHVLRYRARDRATYDASSTEAVTYTVDDPDDAPESLTYGPPFFSLAANYEGQVIVGLNRRLNDIENTIAAATLAKDTMANLESIELGNEPNCESCPKACKVPRTDVRQSLPTTTPSPMAPRGPPRQTTPAKWRGRRPCAPTCQSPVSSRPACTLEPTP